MIIMPDTAIPYDRNIKAVVMASILYRLSSRGSERFQRAYGDIARAGEKTGRNLPRWPATDYSFVLTDMDMKRIEDAIAGADAIGVSDAEIDALCVAYVARKLRAYLEMHEPDKLGIFDTEERKAEEYAERFLRFISHPIGC